MQVIKEFTLRQVTVVCPACNSLFCTPTLESMPNITPESIVEADFHRVLPDPAIRAALVAICAACGYTWWITAFARHLFKPKLVPATPVIDYAKKFAHAVLTGRKEKAHVLDLALLALNGLWCAREAGQSPERWLDLAGQEMERALLDESWHGNREYYNYLMGEICRQAQDFKGAVKNFCRVGVRSMLPPELIERQKMMAIAGNHEPVVLPAHLVQALFCPSKQAMLPRAVGE